MEFAKTKDSCTWLDCTKPAFGAKGGLTWLQQELFNPDAVKALLFEIKDKRLPGGRAIGKCMPLPKSDDSMAHPYAHEQRFLRFFSKQFRQIDEKKLTSKGKSILEKIDKLITMPDILAIFPFVGVFSDALCQLPLEVLSDHIHGYSCVTISTAYWGNLWDFAQQHANVMTLDTWKQVIFEVVYTINELQTAIQFQHNDLHAMNILIDYKPKAPKSNREFLVFCKGGKRKKEKKFIFKNTHLGVIVWDFETSVSYTSQSVVPDILKTNVNNGPPYCTPDYFCAFFDLHSFLMQVLEIAEIPQELKSWIEDLYPKELIPDFEAIARKRTEHMAEIYESETENVNNEPESNIEGVDQNEIQESEGDFYDNIHRLIKHPSLSEPENVVLHDALQQWFFQQLDTVEPNPNEGFDEKSNTEKEDVQSNSNSEGEKEVVVKELENVPEKDTYTEYRIPDEWFYKKNSTYDDYILCGLCDDEKAFHRENRQVGRNNFMEADERGLLAYNKLCKKAWSTYTNLPTPQDVLNDKFFSSFISK